MAVEFKYWYLHHHQLFKQLNENDLNDLGMITNFAIAKQNEEIYFNSGNKRIYLIVKGTIKIVNELNDGSEVVVEVLQDGDLFGALFFDQELTAEGTYQKAVVVSKDVSFCSFYARDFESLLEKKPNLNIKYTKYTGLWFKRITQRYQDLIYKDVKTRLCFFLEEWALKSNDIDAPVWKIRNYLTQKDIAQLIGASRQTVASLFTELESAGYMAYTRNEISILQPLSKSKVS